MFFQKDAETMPRAKIRELQLERLRYTVRYCYERVPFYKRKLDAAGVRPDDIRSLDDLRRIPPTVKTDLRDNYPFGLFAVPMQQIVRIHASSGTTGKPTVVGYTKHDLEIWSDCMARLCAAAGATSDDIVQISFGYGMFTGALGLHYGLEKLGCTVVPNSSGNTEKALMFMRDFKTSALVATPSYALYMAETAKKLEYPMSDYHLRLGLFGSEGCTPEMRTQIETAWGLFATDNYGMSELMGPGVSGECTERDGLHINEDYFLCEVVDPDTLEPLGEGETGELLVTTLTKEGIPLLRYRTRDITRIVYAPCKCGRTLARMDKIKGRSDDMLKIRGVNVFPSQIESVLVGMQGVSPHYQLIVRREGFADTLEIRVELADTSLLDSYSRIEELQNRILHNMHTVLGLQCKVSIVEPNTIERFVGKAKRVVDLRKENV
ncbi:MAG TPA: phenylacetate--CoA ligase [Candidatus Fimenecus excrementigallinarum]|uniref:Phenylacetate-coenzyme A ligase n=1 Tax=Candidatus Fimenecus excrementigallinarum TaxID=2840816 RepID=A0A9D1IFR6_9FIRM|nr:phenylacetate--CoA ligase [Candidatus Fimenecus excrementigallinarum]